MTSHRRHWGIGHLLGWVPSRVSVSAIEFALSLGDGEFGVALFAAPAEVSVSSP